MTTSGLAKSSFAGAFTVHCSLTLPVAAPVPSTAIRYTVPLVTANVIFDCSEPSVSSLHARCVSPVMLVPV